MTKIKKEDATECSPDEVTNTELERKTEQESKTVQAKNNVKNYALGSILIGVIPLPIVDLAALSGLQLKKLHSLAKAYGVEFFEQLGKSLIACLLAGGVSLWLSSLPAGTVKSLVKTIPVYKTATEMVGVSVFDSASTYAIGKVFIKHFESGGTFLDFDPERVKAYYSAQFEAGKEERIN